MARLAVDLRGRGFDVLRTEEAGKDTALDAEQLGFATAENRALLTFNIRDFGPLQEQWQAAGRPHVPARNAFRRTPRQKCLSSRGPDGHFANWRSSISLVG